MNYLTIYESIINRAKLRKDKINGEVHHIVPKCLGGTNELENLVKLTYREHLICHILLTRIYPSNRKLAYALYKLNNYYGSNKSSRSYHRIKRLFAKHQSIRMQINNPMRGKPSPMKGKKHSKVSINKIADSTRKLFMDPEYREKHRRAVSAGVSGVLHPFYGKTHKLESLIKAAKTKKLKSFQVFKDGICVGTWWSQSQCCRDLNLKSVGNLNICLKKGTTYKGYSFRYV